MEGYREVMRRLDLLERRVDEVFSRIDEVGMQLEAINKTFICLYRNRDFSRCSVTVKGESANNP